MVINFAVAFELVLVSSTALLLDKLLGEPRHHPLVWFGNLAGLLESRLNNRSSIARGVLSALILVMPVVLLTWLIQSLLSAWPLALSGFEILVLSFVIGWQSMKDHAVAIYEPLSKSDTAASRVNLARIVSRDTDRMNTTEIAGSTIESVLENGNDCLFASMFWYAAVGPWGAILHRLVNTLDAMWGYRNQRYDRFGKFVARFDDVLGWIPARLTAIGYAITGSGSTAINCWREQAGYHKSPNAGLVIASGAGALNCRIGGPVSYQGEWQDNPWLGTGNAVSAKDIPAAIKLVQRSITFWLTAFALVGAINIYPVI